MLDLMRKNAGTWMVKFILGAIIVVFAFWGVGSYREQSVNRVAVVNGDVIPTSEFQKVYNNILERMRQRFGNSLNDDLIETLQIRKQALNQVIDQKLLIIEAERLGFRVSDEELAGAITKIGAFQIDGVFNKRLFKRVLLNNRLSPEEFEDIQRKSMLMGKLRAFILSNVKVSDLEITEWYKWKDATVSIDFVLFEPEKYDNINVSSDEIVAYYNKHKASYKIDAMLKASYLKFDSKKYESNIKVSKDEIRDYYDSNQGEFVVPKTVEARHILIKADQNANEAIVEEKRKKAADIYSKAAGGKDFAELAKQYSEGPSKDKGGYLGAFRKETMVKPFADKAFSMRAGEVSEPVRTMFGWHIIKIEKINEGHTVGLDKAETEIIKKLSGEKAKSLAYDDAEAASDASYNGEEMKQIASARGIQLYTTKFFSKSQPDDSIEDKEKFAAAAFELSGNDVSDIKDFNGKYYILKVIERIPEKISPLDDVKEKVRVDLISEKKNLAAKDDANKLLAAVKKGGALGAESTKISLVPVTTGFFKRNDTIPKIGFEQEISSMAFKLSKENTVGEKIIETRKGYYVVTFKERKDPDPEKIDLKKEDIKKSIMAQKQRKVFGEYLEQIKSSSDIIVEDAFRD